MCGVFFLHLMILFINAHLNAWETWDAHALCLSDKQCPKHLVEKCRCIQGKVFFSIMFKFITMFKSAPIRSLRIPQRRVAIISLWTTMNSILKKFWINYRISRKFNFLKMVAIVILKIGQQFRKFNKTKITPNSTLHCFWVP